MLGSIPALLPIRVICILLADEWSKYFSVRKCHIVGIRKPSSLALNDIYVRGGEPWMMYISEREI